MPTQFIRNVRAHVLAFMQSAPLIEAEEYRLPKQEEADK